MDIVQMRHEILNVAGRLMSHPLTADGDKISATHNQLCDLGELAHRFPENTLIVETGFNIGCSAGAFLTGNKSARVVSFDLGGERVMAAKTIIDEMFPGRHELILGDSRETVLQFANRLPKPQLSIAFIDGGHSYAVAKADFVNMLRMSTPDTIFVMDDLMPWTRHGLGPTLVWWEMQRKGIIYQLERRVDGVGLGKTIWAKGRLAAG